MGLQKDHRPNIYPHICIVGIYANVWIECWMDMKALLRSNVCAIETTITLANGLINSIAENFGQSPNINSKLLCMQPQEYNWYCISFLGMEGVYRCFWNMHLNIQMWNSNSREPHKILMISGMERVAWRNIGLRSRNSIVEFVSSFRIILV